MDPWAYLYISQIDGDFSRKSQNFPTCYILRPRWRGSPWIGVPALGVKKLEWWGGCRAEKEVLYLQSRGYNAPTWQTDRQTYTRRQHRLRNDL